MINLFILFYIIILNAKKINIKKLKLFKKKNSKKERKFNLKNFF